MSESLNEPSTAIPMVEGPFNYSKFRHSKLLFSKH